MGRGIKHISLDLWMTLIRSHPEYKRKRAVLFSHFFSIADVAKTEKAIRKIDLMANHINETTGGNIDALELYMMVLQEVHTDWRSVTLYDMELFYAETEKLFANYAVLPIDDTVKDTLQMLHSKGITINILSNTGFIKGYLLQQAVIELGWLPYLSFHIFSDETGHSKPHHSMFENVWTRAKNLHPIIEKADILHFGDNAFADVAGADAFGFSSAIFLPSNGSFYQQIETLITA